MYNIHSLLRSDGEDIYSGGAASSVMAPEPSKTSEPSQQTQQTQSPEPSQQTTQIEPQKSSTPSQVVISPESFAQLRKEFEAAKGPTQQQQMTPEQQEAWRQDLLQKTHFFQVSKENLQKMGVAEPTDEQVAQYQWLAANSARHGFGMAKVYADTLAQQQMSQIEQTIAPIRQFIEQQQAAGIINDFHSTYPGLKKYPSVVEAAARVAKGQDAAGNQKSKEVIFKEIATSALDILKSAGANFTLEQLSEATTASGENPASASHSAVPAMNTGLSGSGRSKGGSNADGKSPSEFDIYS